MATDMKDNAKRKRTGGVGVGERGKGRSGSWEEDGRGTALPVTTPVSPNSCSLAVFKTAVEVS